MSIKIEGSSEPAEQAVSAKPEKPKVKPSAVKVGMDDAEKAREAKQTQVSTKPVAKTIKKKDLPEGAVVVNPEKPKSKVYRRVPSKKLLAKLWTSVGVGYALGFVGVACLFGFPILSAVAGALACYAFSLSRNFSRRAEMKTGTVRLPIVFLGMVGLIGGVFMTPIWFKVMATGTVAAGETGQYQGFFNVCSGYSKEAVNVFGKVFNRVVVPILPK